MLKKRIAPLTLLDVLPAGLIQAMLVKKAAGNLDNGDLYLSRLPIVSITHFSSGNWPVWSFE